MYLVPDWGDIVDYGIRLSYQAVGPRQPYAIVNNIPQSGTKNLASIYEIICTDAITSIEEPRT
jgi:hypothetical protein